MGIEPTQHKVVWIGFEFTSQAWKLIAWKDTELLRRYLRCYVRM